MAKKTYSFEADEALLEACAELYETLGLDLDLALNLFLKQSLLQEGLPFPLRKKQNGAAIKEPSASPSPSEMEAPTADYEASATFDRELEQQKEPLKSVKYDDVQINQDNPDDFLNAIARFALGKPKTEE